MLSCHEPGDEPLREIVAVDPEVDRLGVALHVVQGQLVRRARSLTFLNVNVPRIAVPGSLPVPPECVVGHADADAERVLAHDHETVSETWNWRLTRSEDRDCPTVNGTVPARV